MHSKQHKTAWFPRQPPLAQVTPWERSCRGVEEAGLEAGLGAGLGVGLGEHW